MKNNLLSPFFEFAKENPDLIASTDSTGKIAYGQLLENAQRFYQSCSNHNFPNRKAALFFPNGIEALSAIVSTLTAGLCYTILDPSSPSDRNEVICKTGDFDFIITSTELLPETTRIFNPDKILIYQELLNAEPVSFESIPDVAPTDGAILFFTSGSTGTPKGVIHNHERISLGQSTSTTKSRDHYDMIVPLGFVASINMFFTLNAGAKISFFDVRKNGIVAYLNFLREESINISLMTVSAFRALVQILTKGEKLELLKSVVLVGEPVQPSDILLFREVTLPECLLYQFYGTSETRTITFNCFGHQGAIPEKISAGKVAKGVIVKILDESLSELPFGQTGQITVSSALMATEYYNYPEATKKSFIVHPETGLLTYLTGDVGYLTADGFLYHQGRNDFMVKVRGSRVDILEIEDCLLNHPSINDAVVVNKGDSFSETLLVAYCESKSEVKVQELREWVISKLPTYMVPAFFVLKEKLPETLTGKTDRKKLTDEPLDYSVLLGKGESCQIEYDPVYQKLKTIWLEELKLPRLSPNHCFFNDLGGDSILAVTVLERVRTELGIKLPYFILFRYRTLDKLTEYIHKGEFKVVSIDTLRVSRDDKSPVIIFVPPVKGGADTYRFALKSYPENYGLYVITYNLVDDENKRFYPLDYLMDLATKAVEQLKIPEISLYGYSMGGLLAYEIASRIKSVKVKCVINLDISPAFKKKINILGLIVNDYRLLLENIRRKEWKTIKINLWHISICHYYLFSSGHEIKKFERKTNLSMEEAAHLRFFRQFNHQPFDGDMLYIRSTDSHFERIKYNWEKFVKGTITIEQIETTHYQMLNHTNNDLHTQIVVHYFT